MRALRARAVAGRPRNGCVSVPRPNGPRRARRAVRPNALASVAMRTGLDRLATHSALGAELRGARVGLLAHPASVDRRLVHIRDAARRRSASRSRIVFDPEHGYAGEAQDMVGVDDARDALGGTPVRSLYGDHFAALLRSAPTTSRASTSSSSTSRTSGRATTRSCGLAAVLALRACAGARRSRRRSSTARTPSAAPWRDAPRERRRQTARVLLVRRPRAHSRPPRPDARRDRRVARGRSNGLGPRGAAACSASQGL